MENSISHLRNTISFCRSNLPESTGLGYSYFSYYGRNGILDGIMELESYYRTTLVLFPRCINLLLALSRWSILAVLALFQSNCTENASHNQFCHIIVSIYCLWYAGIKKPKSGDDVRSGCCDYIYLVKGYQLKLGGKYGITGPHVKRDGICHGWRNKLLSPNIPLLVMKPGIYRTHIVLFADGTTNEFKELPDEISQKLEKHGIKDSSHSASVKSKTEQ
jgi:hypothetical protein